MKQSTHAKETRPLRSGRHENRKKDAQRLCHLPGGHEAKAKRKAEWKVIESGIFDRMAHPSLQWERDELFDEYLKCLDQKENWLNERLMSVCNYADEWRQRKKLNELFDEQLSSISIRLLSLDARISPLHGR